MEKFSEVCMNQFRSRGIVSILRMFLLAVVPALLLFSQPSASAQSLISGDIAGIITDSSGAAIVGASIMVTNTGTGAAKTVTSGAAGDYRVGLLQPGTYTVSVTAPNFQTTQSSTAVSVGQTAEVNISLSLARGTTTVQVLANTVPLLQPENSDLATTITEEQVQNLPNPGGDITYYINLSPGVVMNTQMHYGNSSAFGLPATSNNFTVNGAEDNDPFLNLNNSGPSNLLLGSNDVDEVNIVANAYSAQYGALGGVQENITTRSGTNAFHGNATYYWTNSDMNANDWFNDNTGAPEPYANANQWGAGGGGPIKKDKAFFFVNYEGLRFVTSPVDPTFLPSALYQSNPAGTYGPQTVSGNAAYVVTNPSVLGNDGNCDNNSSFLYFNGNAAECGFYKKMFALYNGAPRAASAIGSASTGSGGCSPTATLNNQPSGCQDLNPGTDTIFTSFPTSEFYSNYLQEGPKNHLYENLFTARADFKFSSNDSAFVHFKYDHGLQPTYVDPINPVFNAQSDQPDYEGQMEETHTFTPNLVNQFILSGTWYSAYFLSDNQSAALSAFPYDMELVDGSFSNMGNNELAWPEGRDVTQYQINDDVSWTRGKHTASFGMLFKRDDVTDADLGILNVPLGAQFGPAEGAFGGLDLFAAGIMLEGVENFPQHKEVPIRLYNIGFYAQDQWKVLSNFQITAGVRVEHNSNPVCVIDCFAHLLDSYNNVTATLDTPYNSVLKSGLRTAFDNMQKFTIDPRVGFTYSPPGHDHTVIRGGFGLFTDIFPATIADSLLNNAPLNPEFINLFSLADPSQPGNFISALAQTNAAFVAGYPAGDSANMLAAANPNFTVPSLFNADKNIHYPTYEEFSLQWQQQIGRHDSFQVGYVGNHGYHEPIEDVGVNMYGFGGAPSAPALPAFGSVTEVQSEASSNYNGVIASVKHESKYATATLNYSWSHALDEISNGGILAFGFNSINPVDPFNLALQNYGNADYDIRQNMNGSYLLHVPYFGGPKILTDLWQMGGTVFLHSGFPFSVTDNALSGALAGQNDPGPIYAAPVPGAKIPSSCGKSATVTACFGPPISTPLATGAEFMAPTAFGGQRRNQFHGPGYFSTDFNLLKGFHLPGSESNLFQIGAQAYNILNHINFAQPTYDASNPSFGLIQSDVSPATSVYGSFLGADAAPRILQLKAKLTF
jgi:hypothetical protein